MTDHSNQIRSAASQICRILTLKGRQSLAELADNCGLDAQTAWLGLGWLAGEGVVALAEEKGGPQAALIRVSRG